MLATVALLSFASHALAWNREAHQLVAWVAEARLSDRAKAGVNDLLGDAALSDAEVASWADQVRGDRRESAPWHYVNIPVDADGYHPQKHGNNGQNVIDAINRFTKVLADKSKPREERVEPPGGGAEPRTSVSCPAYARAREGASMATRKRYRTTFTDTELIDALMKVGNDPERPEGNMGAFFRQQARPERERQIAKAKELAAARIRAARR